MTWVGTSWKMNKTLSEAKAFARILKDAEILKNSNIQKFIAPPFTLLREVQSILESTPVKVGAQNMHWEENGAWTGEISAPMLKDCGAEFVELGHSERRAHFGETNDTVALKTLAAIKNGLIPLICIGESADQRDSDLTQKVIEQQINQALSKLDKSQKRAEILFAYEPVWAIGDDGTPATAEYAEKTHYFISQILLANLGRFSPCLYGGSVNLENCQELINCQHIDGLFIGRSAWDANDYIKILEMCGYALLSEK